MRVPDFAGKIRRELGSADDLGQVDLVVSARAVVGDRQRHNRRKRVILSGHHWPYSRHRLRLLKALIAATGCCRGEWVFDERGRGKKRDLCIDFKMEKPSVHPRT